MYSWTRMRWHTKLSDRRSCNRNRSLRDPEFVLSSFSWEPLPPDLIWFFFVFTSCIRIFNSKATNQFYTVIDAIMNWIDISSQTISRRRHQYWHHENSDADNHSENGELQTTPFHAQAATSVTTQLTGLCRPKAKLHWFTGNGMDEWINKYQSLGEMNFSWFFPQSVF